MSEKTVRRHEWTGVNGCRYAVDNVYMWLHYTPTEGEARWLMMHRTNEHGIEILRLSEALEAEKARSESLMKWRNDLLDLFYSLAKGALRDTILMNALRVGHDPRKALEESK